MSNPIFRRLVWKEYRLQRPFWISMVVLAVLLSGIVLLFTPEGNSTAKIMWLFDIALGLSALYALGCGATLFATEHEAGTYDFQRSLPVSAGRLFWAKMTFAVASTLAILGLLWCLAAAWAHFRLPDPLVHRQIWAIWGFGAVEALIWGTLFSLLLKRPLKAAILGVLFAAVSVHFLVAESGPQYFRAPYLDALPRRAVFAAVLALPTVWLGLRWFRERVVPSGGLGRLGLLGERGVEEAAGPACADMPTQGGILGRLLWQHLRQSAGMLSVV
ncbi:MAG: hypothetical protein ABIP48_00525, partial [Planctomycetota bacterium]